MAFSLFGAARSRFSTPICGAFLHFPVPASHHRLCLNLYLYLSKPFSDPSRPFRLSRAFPRSSVTPLLLERYAEIAGAPLNHNIWSADQCWTPSPATWYIGTRRGPCRSNNTGIYKRSAGPRVRMADTGGDGVLRKLEPHWNRGMIAASIAISLLGAFTSTQLYASP